MTRHVWRMSSFLVGSSHICFRRLRRVWVQADCFSDIASVSSVRTQPGLSLETQTHLLKRRHRTQRSQHVRRRTYGGRSSSELPMSVNLMDADESDLEVGSACAGP
jgi:hypothetical protein